MTKKHLTEFVGTFFLVLTIVMAVNNGAGAFAPLAIGSALMAMAFAGAQHSGAHFNPAVTIAVWMRGSCPAGEVPYYVVSQIFGGMSAALVGRFLLGAIGKADAIAPGHFEPFAALGAEFLGTFALAWVVLNVATTVANKGEDFYGIAIGFTVLAMVYALGPVSGGAFNPAVGFGIATAGMASWGDLWIYIVGPVIGGAAAATVFQAVNGRA